MDAARQKDAIEALHDWSRWVIGLGFTAGAGCVVLLRDAGDGPARGFLIGGIAAFALAVLAAILLRHALSLTVERLPLTDARGAAMSIHDHRPGGRASIRLLARAQLVLLVLGAGAVLGWVVLLPPP
jgi:hypothetical protein